MFSNLHMKKDRAYRVLIADDHPMVRAGIRAMLSIPDGWDRWELEEAATSEEAVGRSKTGSFDLVLMDYRLPGRGGDTATRTIREGCPDTRVLALSNFEDRSYVLRMVEAGASGYLLKNVGLDGLVLAMRTVMAGRPYYSSEVAILLMDARLRAGGPLGSDRLTLREREVLQMILAGWKDREIAARWFVAKRTVDKHRQNLMSKLGVRSSMELAAWAARAGLL
jgi:DNA-binding NarL/FixJ family response regulator